MSTKIYNAYKFDGKIDELICFLHDIRKKHSEEFVKIAAVIISAETTISPKYSDIWDKVRNSIQSGLNDHLNPTASAMVYFLGRKLIVQFFGLNRDFIYKNLDSRFTDYHYQNQTDPPEEISEKDWQKRKRDWDKIIKNYISFSDAGLSYDFCTPYIEQDVAAAVMRRFSQEVKILFKNTVIEENLK